ncbi:hypothetical protein G5V59_08835 [Nocardioides sp. W3-2-3]|uniref:hypothetical protein n=1 Tax=Nocardioides convexus TaxID=2712224 RepID=UPI0024182AE1|nr:hypothetical protein [Nocardioides convexus]NHA00197.1 hypothetical protein [Nocardioides convexus]
MVARLRDPANLEVARLIGRDRPGRTALLDIRETVARLVVQTSRQSGAAAVYRESVRLRRRRDLLPRRARPLCLDVRRRPGCATRASR